jgi:pyrophosphatase PpaX
MIKALLFDWDGTLADSAGLGLKAFQQTFAELGVAFRLEVYEATYSPNWYATYEALGLPQDKWRTADDLWMKHYGEQTAELIEDVAETLLTLKQKGYCLGVVTSGTESRIYREIAGSALRECFDVVICNEHVVNKKPHPEGLELALQRIGKLSSEAAYVGDSPEDIQMGKQTGVLTVGVRSSYPSSARLASAEPELMLDSIAELAHHFGNLRPQEPNVHSGMAQ